jgi:choline dehydrogenase-like flavoprotein
MYTQSAPEVHDVIVIGSGAAGGMSAWNLAVNHGVKVLMLDAGTRFKKEPAQTNTPKHTQQHTSNKSRGERAITGPIDAGLST